MKSFTRVISGLYLLLTILPAQAGLWDIVENTVNKKITEQTKKIVNESADDLINGVKKSATEDDTQNAQETTTQNSTAVKSTDKITAPTIEWDRYDFIPGDEVIFADGPSQSEENGEFPSRWDVVSGNTEIIKINGQKVITLANENASIIPYINNSNEDYLPEVFTIEFDAYYQPNLVLQLIKVNFYDKKNQKRLSNEDYELGIYVNSIKSGSQHNGLAGKKYSSTGDHQDPIAGWRHIAISYTKGKLKVYMNSTRLINIPHFNENPTGLTISLYDYNNNEPVYIKNVRIAKDGVKYYDRLLADGKIIVNGIRFNTGQSSIKPESYGAINKIVELMKENTSVNLSIEGHTDSDGSNASNQTLSEARAKAVMAKIVALGINKSRLKSKGFGESKPIDNNSTAEGKANNRRVEFVKF